VAPHNAVVSASVPIVRLIGFVLAAVAAALLIFGSWSSAWWLGDQGGLTFSAGLRFVEMCSEGECHRATLGSIGGAGWMRVGLGAFTAGMVGAALLLAAAGVAVARPARRSSLRGAATIACVLAAVFGVTYVMLAPAEVTNLRGGGAMFVYFAGAALGAGSSVGLLSPRPSADLRSS
jgi:hypothetical protein